MRTTNFFAIVNCCLFSYLYRTQFKIPQGVNAFDYSERINLIGELNLKYLLVWNDHVTLSILMLLLRDDAKRDIHLLSPRSRTKHNHGSFYSLRQNSDTVVHSSEIACNVPFSKFFFQKFVIRAIIELTVLPLQLVLLENVTVFLYLPTKGNRLWRNQANLGVKDANKIYKTVNLTIVITVKSQCIYRSFSQDVTAAMLTIQNKSNSVRVELFYFVNTVFCCNKFAWLLATWVETLYLHSAVVVILSRFSY